MPGESRKTPELVRKCQDLRRQGKPYEAIAQELNIPNKSMVWKWLQTAETYLQDPEPFAERHSIRKPLLLTEQAKRLEICRKKIVFYEKQTLRTKGPEKEKCEKLLLDYLKEARLIEDDKLRTDLKNQRTLNTIYKRWLQNAGQKYIEGALEDFKAIREITEEFTGD